MSKIVALIPARSGSKRCPGKNTRMFFGHPLIAYTIRVARESGIFGRILVSTDSQDTIEIAESYGADAILRPDEISKDASTDLEWVNHALNEFSGFDYFAILRPTSPFRSAALIMDAWGKFKGSCYQSLRTVEIRGHPGKMWDRWADGSINPICGYHFSRMGFDQPTQYLHREHQVFTQNACLQIAKTRLLPHTITGTSVYGYNMTGDLQGFDINTELDWILAEELVKRGMVKLPQIGG